MENFFSKYSVVALIVFCVVVVCGYGKYTDSGENFSPVETTEQEQYWRERISTDGGSVAYQEFTKHVAGLSIEEQHTLSHKFGGALFEVEGVSGLPVCDSQFSYGCSHEFLGRAIAKLGLGVVANLNEMCFKALKSKSLSCQHGIGHGIQASLGYTFEDLKKALAVCGGLSHPGAPICGNR